MSEINPSIWAQRARSVRPSANYVALETISEEGGRGKLWVEFTAIDPRDHRSLQGSILLPNYGGGYRATGPSVKLTRVSTFMSVMNVVWHEYDLKIKDKAPQKVCSRFPIIEMISGGYSNFHQACAHRHVLNQRLVRSAGHRFTEDEDTLASLVAPAGSYAAKARGGSKPADHKAPGQGPHVAPATPSMSMEAIIKTMTAAMAVMMDAKLAAHTKEVANLMQHFEDRQRHHDL